jgi:hypothetical protein
MDRVGVKIEVVELSRVKEGKYAKSTIHNRGKHQTQPWQTMLPLLILPKESSGDLL